MLFMCIFRGGGGSAANTENDAGIHLKHFYWEYETWSRWNCQLKITLRPSTPITSTTLNAVSHGEHLIVDLKLKMS